MTLTDAYLSARGRGVLPSALSSREQREAFTAAVRARAVFSARTTHVRYLEILRATIEDLLKTEVQTVDKEGKPWMKSIGQAEARLMLKQALAALHYDPENGHFGTPEDADIPPAARGSLQDLSSDRRLDLIIDIQRQRWQAAGQRERGMEPAVLKVFPAWELSGTTAAEPRQNWPARWIAAGGVFYGPGQDRMIAGKTDPIWERLGSLPDYPDAIDGGMPPFAFGSTRRWQAVSARECRALGVDVAGVSEAGSRKPEAPGKTPASRLPVPVIEIPQAVSPDTAKAVAKAAGGTIKAGRMTFDERLAAALARGAAAREAADAA